VLPATRQRWHSSLYPAEAGTRFSDPGGMQGWVDLVGWLHTVMVYPPIKTVTHPSTNRARRRVTSFMPRTTLATTPRRFRHTARYWSKITNLTNNSWIWSPAGGDPIGILPRSLTSENKTCWIIVWRCFRDPTCSHFGTATACYRRTNGRTDRPTHGHSIYLASIASRGNKATVKTLQCA